MKPNKTTKRRKTILVTQNRDSENKISKLPDDLISHILSFMPTKFAVRTSILSNRWKYLWTNITSLDFDHEHSSNSQQVDSFIDFVDRFFQLCKPSQVQLFRFTSRNRIRCSSRCSLLEENWISKAIKLDPSQIIIQVHYHSVPLSLFTCKTLTTLMLDSFCNIKLEIPSLVHLPNLKILGTSSIPEELLQTFIYGCPVLEDLSFTRWDFDKNGYVLNIRTQTLKKMRLIQYRAKKMFEIVINTPNLQYLDVTNNLKFHVENLQSLVEASIRLDYYQNMDWKTRSEGFIELLRAVRGVKYLAFTITDVEEFLHGALLPRFHYLTSLKMVFAEYNCRKFIPQILESSPNLKYLLLEKAPCYGQFTDPMFQVQSVSRCSLLHLEEIQLKGFEGSKDDEAVVKYLLSNAKVLKRLKVSGIKLTLKQRRKYYNKLLKLRKAARNCKIEFHGDHVQIPSLQGNGPLSR